jgi:hypothetical protein
MSPDPTQPVKKATKTTTSATTEAASTGARSVEPSRLTKGLAKLLPLSLRTKIRLLLARLWAKLKTWRLRRRARNV